MRCPLNGTNKADTELPEGPFGVFGPTLTRVGPINGAEWRRYGPVRFSGAERHVDFRYWNNGNHCHD